jgi:hypothetical protein
MNPARRKFLKTGAIAGALAGVLPAVGGTAYFAGLARGSTAPPPGSDSLPPEATSGPWRNLRAVREKKVFDYHTHAWETPTQGKNYTEEKRMHDNDEWKDYTPDLVRSMDAHGVSQAALSPAFVTFVKYIDTSYKA